MALRGLPDGAGVSGCLSEMMVVQPARRRVADRGMSALILPGVRRTVTEGESGCKNRGRAAFCEESGRRTVFPLSKALNDEDRPTFNLDACHDPPLPFVAQKFLSPGPVGVRSASGRGGSGEKLDPVSRPYWERALCRRERAAHVVLEVRALEDSIEGKGAVLGCELG